MSFAPSTRGNDISIFVDCQAYKSFSYNLKVPPFNKTNIVIGAASLFALINFSCMFGTYFFGYEWLCANNDASVFNFITYEPINWKSAHNPSGKLYQR